MRLLQLKPGFDVEIPRYRDLKLFEKVAIPGYLPNKYIFIYNINLSHL
jgi:hypothetical protein